MAEGPAEEMAQKMAKEESKEEAKEESKEESKEAAKKGAIRQVQFHKAERGFMSEDDARYDSDDDEGDAAANHDQESSPSLEDPRLEEPWPQVQNESAYVPVGAYDFQPKMGSELGEIYLYDVGYWRFDKALNRYVEAMCQPAK